MKGLPRAVWGVIFSVLLLQSFASGVVDEVTYDFRMFTNNGTVSKVIGESQLFIDLVNTGSNEIVFKLRNTGPEYCRIEQIYIDGPMFFTTNYLIDADDGSGGDVGVDFSFGAVPDEIPSWNTLVPPFDSEVSFGSDSGPDSEVLSPDKSGIEPYEYLDIVFIMQDGVFFNDVVEMIEDESLRVGMHVQSLGEDGELSESFVNNPEPATLIVLGIGAIGLIRGKRK